MFTRTALALLSALTLATAASADQQYDVTTPTDAPYTRFEHQVVPGSFVDTFDFLLSITSPGYIWLFPRQDAWFGFDKVENTANVSLVLRNNDTGVQYIGRLFHEVDRTVGWFEPGVMSMVVSGFDPNKSLYLTGTFDAGSYTATISGLATGSAGTSYIAKFAFTEAVPEPTTTAMMLLGLGAIGWVAARRRGQ